MRKAHNKKELTKHEFIVDSYNQLLEKKTTIEKIGAYLKLLPEQILFAEQYANSSGDGKFAARLAYNIEEDYQAVAMANRQLQNMGVMTLVSILTYCNGMSPEYVDMQLLRLINQDAHLPTKLGAIKQANELMGRVNNNTDFKVTANFNFDNFSVEELQKFIELGEKAKK